MDNLKREVIGSEVPRGILAERTIAVKEGESLVVGVVMRVRGEFVVGEHLRCQVQFVNSSGKFLNGDGCELNQSQDLHNYVQIPIINNDSRASWSNESIVVPKHARCIVLTLNNDQINSAIQVLGGIQCVNLAKKPLLDLVYSISQSQAYKYRILFERKTQARNIALFSATYLDENFNAISGAITGLSYSERFSHFKYLHCSKNGESSGVFLLPPEGAVYVYIQIHPLASDSSIALRQDPQLLLAPDVASFSNDPDWCVVGNEEPCMAVTIKEEHSLADIFLVNVTYVGMTRSDRVFGSFRWSDAKNINVQETCLDNKSDISISLFGTNSLIVSKRFFFDIKDRVGDFNLAFSNRDNAIGFVKQTVMLNDMPVLQGDWSNIVIDKEITIDAFDVLPYWGGVFQLQFPKAAECSGLEWDIDWLGKNDVLVGRTNGHVQIGDFDKSKPSINAEQHSSQAHVVISSTDVPNHHILIEFQPMPTALRGLITLRMENGSSDISTSYRVNPFVFLDTEKMDKSAILDVQKLQSISTWATRETLNALIRGNPDKMVYETSMQCFANLDDISSSVSVSNKILRTSKDAHLCRLARNTLAMLHVLSMNWLPYVNNIASAKRQQKEHVPAVHNVAIILGAGQSIEACALASGVLKETSTSSRLKSFVVVPFGKMERSLSDQLFECEKVNGVICYQINCISQKDANDVPIDRRLEFFTHLSSQIIELEKANAIAVSLDDKGLEQTLIGLALSRKYHIPLVLQISVSPSTVVWSSNAATEVVFSRTYILKAFKCMSQVGAIIATSERIKEELITHNISPAKIFVLPNEPLQDSQIDGTSKRVSIAIQETYNKALLFAASQLDVSGF